MCLCVCDFTSESHIFSQALEGGESTPEPEPEPKPVPSPRRPLKTNPPPAVSSTTPTSQPQQKVGGSVGMVTERLDIYKQAIREAESAGDSGKARRYKRGLTTLEQVSWL